MIACHHTKLPCTPRYHALKVPEATIVAAVATMREQSELNDAVLHAAFLRYIESCFRVHPDIEEDGSNLPDVVMQLWSTVQQDPPPATCLLGTKTFYVSFIKMLFAHASPKKEVCQFWDSCYV